MGWSGGASNSGGAGSGNNASAVVPRPGGATGDVIEMDPQFGQAMGLKAGQKVNRRELLCRKQEKEDENRMFFLLIRGSQRLQDICILRNIEPRQLNDYSTD